MWRELSLGLAAPFSAARQAQPVGWRSGQPVGLSAWQWEAAAWHAAFVASGVGDVALVLEDGLSALAALLAAWHAGCKVWWPGDALPATAQHLQSQGVRLAGDWPLDTQPLRPLAAAPAVTWQPLNPAAEALVVFTSGSTGAPAAIPKRLHQLFDEVRALEAAFGPRLGGVERVEATVSHQHIYGLLFRLLWPWAAGRPVAADRVGYLEDLAGRPGRLALIASPAHLKRLEASHLSGLAARLAAVFSSGGPLPAEALGPCNQHLGQTPIEVYGSSETGGVAWRQRAPGAAEDPAWRPLPGVEWRIADGRLHLRSPHLGDAAGAPGAWWPAQDCAEAAPDGFLLLGRADRIVKIEEKRVSLSAVEQTLRAVGGLQDLRLVLLPGPRQEIGVVLLPDAAAWSDLEGQGRAAWLAPYRAALAGLLEATVRPRRYRLVAEWPFNAQGKVTQAALQALFDPLRPPARLTRSEDPTEVQFCIDVEARHPGFDGHFPDHPVLPGVVQLDWAERFGREAFADLPARVLGMEQLKFQQIIAPGGTVDLRLRWDAAKGHLHFALSSARGAHASGRLVMAPAAGGPCN